MTGEEKVEEVPTPPPAPPAAEPPKAAPAAAPAEAAPAFEAPSLVMDQEELDAKVTVNVETVFTEIAMVKIFAMVFFLLAGIFAFLPYIISDGFSVEVLPAVVLGLVGGVMGVMGIFSRGLRKWMLLVAPIILIVAVAVRPLTSAIGSLDTVDIILGLAFAVFWFLAVEYLHALSRFVEVGEMAIKRRLTNFNLSGVVKHFLGWGFLMLAIIIGVTLGVIGLVPLLGNLFWTMIAIAAVLVAIGTIGTLMLILQENVTQGILFALATYLPGIVIALAGFLWAGEGGLLGDSAELFSVFGIGIAAAVVFTLMGLILTVWYTFAEGVSKVEKVEYSREKLQEMLASGQVLDLEGVTPGGGENP